MQRKEQSKKQNGKKDSQAAVHQQSPRLQKSQSMGKINTNPKANNGSNNKQLTSPRNKDQKYNSVKNASVILNSKPQQGKQNNNNINRQGSIQKLEKNRSGDLKKVKSDKNIRPRSVDNHPNKNQAHGAPKDNKKGNDHRASVELGKGKSKEPPRLNNNSKLSQIPENSRKQPLKSVGVPGKDTDPRKLNNSINLKKDKNGSLHVPVKQAVASVPVPAVPEEKELGLIMMKPQFDKLIVEPLQITDLVFQKYFDMISNDNDTIYVMNSLPEIKDYRKDEEPDRKKVLSQQQMMEPVLTGRQSKISGLFDHLTIDKVVTALKNKPAYLQTKAKPVNMKLILQTKFKVSVDIGYLQYLIEGDKLVITRIYLSKIYRRMNYLAYVILEVMRICLRNHAQQQKCCVFLHDRNLSVVKFFKYMGFKIERILTDSKSQKVDYFQEFVNKRKEFLAAAQNLMAS